MGRGRRRALILMTKLTLFIKSILERRRTTIKVQNSTRAEPIRENYTGNVAEADDDWQDWVRS